MVGPAIKKYAQEKGLKISNGVAYGIIDGFMVTLTDGMDMKQLAFSGAITDDVAQKVSIKLEDKAFTKQYRIIRTEIAREYVRVTFYDTIGTMKKITAALDVIPGILKECGVIGDGFCTACGNDIDVNHESKVALINGVAHRIHSACASSVDIRAEIEKNDYEMEQKNIGRGIFGALLGSVLGGVVWGIVYYIGYLASAIGVLIAFLAKRGYELLGGKTCKAKVFIILLATVFGVIVGQVGVYFVLIGMQLISEGYSLMAIPYIFIETLKVDSEFAGAFFGDMAGGLFFGVLGSIGTVVLSNKEHKNATIKSQILE